MNKNKIFVLLLLAWLACFSTQAKEALIQTLNWPSDSSPVLRFGVGKIQKLGSFKGQNAYIIDMTVESLEDRDITG